MDLTDEQWVVLKPLIPDYFRRVVGHVVEGTASGFRSQAAENSCDSMPNAVLVRV